MPDSTTRARLRAALAADPLDTHLRQVYADCLEELGETEAANRHRWIAGLPSALRGAAVHMERFLETTLRPTVLALFLATAVTFLDPSPGSARREGGGIHSD